jgi:hypothetical protein
MPLSNLRKQGLCNEQKAVGTTFAYQRMGSHEALLHSHRNTVLCDSVDIYNEKNLKWIFSEPS